MADGRTYERLALVEYLKDNDASPLDPSKKITVDGLVENRALRSMIEKYVASDDCSDETKDDYNAGYEGVGYGKSEETL